MCINYERDLAYREKSEYFAEYTIIDSTRLADAIGLFHFRW